MGAKQSYAQSRVLEALERSGGLLGQAAADLGCSRRTVSRYLERFPKLRQARLEIGERNLDQAEAKLHEAIERGDGPMIRFCLQTKGKERGLRA